MGQIREGHEAVGSCADRTREQSRILDSGGRPGGLQLRRVRRTKVGPGRREIGRILQCIAVKAIGGGGCGAPGTTTLLLMR